MLSPHPDTPSSRHLTTATPTLPSTTPSRLEHQISHIAAGPWELPLSCSSSTPPPHSDPRSPIPAPIPSRDTCLKHHNSISWALGTAYCRPVANALPRFLPPYDPDPTLPYDTGFKHQQRISRALGTACVHLLSTSLASDQSATNLVLTPSLPQPLLPTSKLAA